MGFLLFLVILVAAWQSCYWIGVDLLGLWKPYAMPSPVGVAQSFLQLCEDGELFQATANSLLRGISGYVIAVIIGVILLAVILGIVICMKRKKKKEQMRLEEDLMDLDDDHESKL